MKKIIAVLLLSVLAACQGTATNRPKLTKQEIAEEQRAQEAYANEVQYAEGEAPVPITAQMQNRFNAIAAKVGLAGETLCEEVGVNQCFFGIELEEDKILNAHADGKKVVVSSAMAEFAETDYELANVLAHEYAHNIMGHVAKSTQNVVLGSVLGAIVDAGLKTQGVQTGGVGQQLGQNYAVLHYSPEFENEADYVGMYILARSGYDISRAPNFWRRMSAADKRGIYTRTTHPTNPERYVALSKTIEEINYKKAHHLPLVPEFEKKK